MSYQAPREVEILVTTNTVRGDVSKGQRVKLPGDECARLVGIGRARYIEIAPPVVEDRVLTGSPTARRHQRMMRRGDAERHEDPEVG